MNENLPTINRYNFDFAFRILKLDYIIYIIYIYNIIVSYMGRNMG